MRNVQSHLWLGALASLAGVLPAQAGARIDLRPTPPMPPGGYAPNAIINVDVFMVDTGNPEGDLHFGLLILPFHDTSPTLSFPGFDEIAGTSDDDQFVWATPPPAPPASAYPHLPTPTWYLGDTLARPPYSFTLPDSGEVRLGRIVVDAGLTGGALDAMNRDDPEFERSATAEGREMFSPYFVWSAYDGQLTGGHLEIVVPEPSTAILLVGASCAMRGYRRTRRLEHFVEAKS